MMRVFVPLAFALWMTAAPPQEGTVQAPTSETSPVTLAPDKVSFDFEFKGLAVPHWAIEVYADGTGRYDEIASGERRPAESKQTLHVSQAIRKRLYSGISAVSANKCSSKAKHIANTGQKTIAYRLQNGNALGPCTFNYSDDDTLMDAVAAFQAIANTLQIGAQLAHLHRFDRLGLDAQIELLVNENAAGRALEIGNIAPVLRSVAEDERVMERVRRKAARLLQDADVSPR